jgi:hypothetical protein
MPITVLHSDLDLQGKDIRIGDVRLEDIKIDGTYSFLNLAWLRQPGSKANLWHQSTIAQLDTFVERHSRSDRCNETSRRRKLRSTLPAQSIVGDRSERSEV